MSFFVDANVPVYASGTDRRAKACVELLEAVAAGAPAFTSVAAVEEIWHLELRGRPTGLSGLTREVVELFSPLLEVGESALREALDLDAPGLGPNDRLHLAVCAQNGISVVVSADEEFDAIDRITRVDPLDAEAMAALAAG